MEHEDYLDVLFPDRHTEEAKAEQAEKDAYAAIKARRDASIAPSGSTAPCPRCAGTGRLAQFQHRKGGECFGCGGRGVFSRYAA